MLFVELGLKCGATAVLSTLEEVLDVFCWIGEANCLTFHGLVMSCILSLKSPPKWSCIMLSVVRPHASDISVSSRLLVALLPFRMSTADQVTQLACLATTSSVRMNRFLPIFTNSCCFSFSDNSIDLSPCV